MRPPSRFAAVLAVAAAAFVTSLVAAQRRDAFVLSRDHPAIRYSSGELDNPVERLNERLAAGEARLTYDAGNGYLRSLLEALAIPVSSQTLVFSKTSFQAELVTMHNPRAVFFERHRVRGLGARRRRARDRGGRSPPGHDLLHAAAEAAAARRTRRSPRAARPSASPATCRGTRAACRA